jgi:hypothetical protein
MQQSVDCIDKSHLSFVTTIMCVTLSTSNLFWILVILFVICMLDRITNTVLSNSEDDFNCYFNTKRFPLRVDVLVVEMGGKLSKKPQYKMMLFSFDNG